MALRVGVGYRVNLQMMRCAERLTAPFRLALIGLLSRMGADVFLQVTPCGELFGAVGAVECLTGVNAFVGVESITSTEGPVTAVFVTCVRSLTRVDPTVHLEAIRGQKGFLTALKVAAMGKLSLVGLEVGPQVANGHVATITAVVLTLVAIRS